MKADPWLILAPRDGRDSDHVSDALGDRRGTLPTGWINETIIALLGDARIDATGSRAAGARMTFLGLAGDAIVVVPPGSRVTGGGLSVFGDRKIEVTPGDGPEIRIDGYSLFGDVKVSDQPSARTS